MFSKTFNFLIPLLVLVQTSFANDSISTTKKNTLGITYRQRTIALNYERLLHKRFGVGCSVLPIYKDIDSNFRVKGALAEVNARWYFLKMPVDEPTSGLYISANYLFGYIDSKMKFVGYKYDIPQGNARFHHQSLLFGTFVGLGVKKYIALKKRLYIEAELRQQIYQLSKSSIYFEQNGLQYSLSHWQDRRDLLWEKYVFTDFSIQFGFGYKF